MRSKIRIVVSTKRLRYELNLRRNITIIQGDSASGKTTLIQIVSDYLSGRAGPGTEVVCDRKCSLSFYFSFGPPASAHGKKTENTVPPPSFDATLIYPLCARTISLARYSPIPTPGWSSTERLL